MISSVNSILSGLGNWIDWMHCPVSKLSFSDFRAMSADGMALAVHFLDCRFDVLGRMSKSIGSELSVCWMIGRVPIWWIPFTVGGIGSVRIIPGRRPLWQFGAVGGGGEDFAESIELPSLRCGEGAVRLGSSKVIDTLLGDGALGVGKLVGFVGVEGASCGGFGGEILNISACVGDRWQWAAISRSMARQGGIGFVEGAAFFLGERAGVALLFLQMGLLSGGEGVFRLMKLHGLIEGVLTVWRSELVDD